MPMTWLKRSVLLKNGTLLRHMRNATLSITTQAVCGCNLEHFHCFVNTIIESLSFKLSREYVL